MNMATGWIKDFSSPCNSDGTENSRKIPHIRESLRRRILAFSSGREEGQSLVEFALVAPILIAVLMGIFEFGIAFYNQLQLTQAVGQGALYLQQQDPSQSSMTDPCQSTLTYIENSAPSLNPANITLSLTMGSNSPVVAHSCAADLSELASGENVTVKATYPCNITLFAINLDHLSSWNFTCNLSAQVTEYQY